MANNRQASILMDKEVFRTTGYALVDKLADFFESLYERPVTAGLFPKELQQLIPQQSLPENGTDATVLLQEIADKLMQYSLFNGHPKFMAYITSSPAPIGALADMLAAAINPNVGAQILSPLATEIEKQTVKWLAQFIGLEENYAGILVSGGAMANYTGFLAGIKAKVSKHVETASHMHDETEYGIYCSKATHTWIEKAVGLFAPGNKILRMIDALPDNKMDISKLELIIATDIQNGIQPIMIIGTAGDVSTGAVDDLNALAMFAERYSMWFHIDGAYGIPAATLPELHAMFTGTAAADSIALDPHKWLYNPLEAGCTLVKDPKYLTDAFSSHPAYYNFDATEDLPFLNYYEYGLQNSRGFRALKVWITLQQVGRKGYEEMIREDIRLSQLLFHLADAHPLFEAVTQSLSITTFRFIPADLNVPETDREAYLNQLNEALLNELQQGGKVFLSVAVIQDKYCLRSCIVNFRTSENDIHEIIDIIVEEGNKTHKMLQEVNHISS